jgi:hypothetical protein
MKGALLTSVGGKIRQIVENDGKRVAVPSCSGRATFSEKIT